eukprot:scaffold698226_cov63-Attheya_sp.AAC.1
MTESPTVSPAPTIDDGDTNKETATDPPTVDSDAEITSDPPTSSPTPDDDTESPTIEPTADDDDDDDGYDADKDGYTWDKEPDDDPFERDPDSTYVPPDDDPVGKDPADEDKWTDGANSNAQHNETPDEMMHDKNIQILVGVLVALGFAGMLYSAYQVMQNPDGLCARQDSNYAASPLGRDDHSFAHDLELT